MNLPFDAKICAELTARAVIQQTRLTLPPLTTTTLNHSFAFLPSAKKHEDGKNSCVIRVVSGFPCTALHSVMNQNARLSSLAKFKCGVVKILVATDVASR